MKKLTCLVIGAFGLASLIAENVLAQKPYDLTRVYRNWAHEVTTIPRIDEPIKLHGELPYKVYNYLIGEIGKDLGILINEEEIRKINPEGYIPLTSLERFFVKPDSNAVFPFDNVPKEVINKFIKIIKGKSDLKEYWEVHLDKGEVYVNFDRYLYKIGIKPFD